MTQEDMRGQPGHGARNDDSPRHVMWMLLCAGASFILYLLLPGAAAKIISSKASYAYEVFPWVQKYTKESLFEFHQHLAGLHGKMWFFLACAALILLHAAMLRVAKGCRSLSSQRLIFAAGSACMLSLLFAPVMLSTDAFAYAFYGRVLSVHGSNAYAANPEIASDPFFALFNGQSLVSMYGPLWTMISAVTTRVAGDNVGLNVFLFRAISALSAIAAGGLIWKSLRIYSPERAAQGLVMFLWNPLVIIEAGLSGHNDSTMVALAMLAVWLHLKGRKTGAVVALVLSALVKFVTGMLVPLYMLMVLRGMRTWRARIVFMAQCCVCAAAVTAVCMVCARVKTDAPASHQATSPEFYINNFHELIFTGLRRWFGEDEQSAQVPVDYGSWWVEATRDTLLRPLPSKKGAVLAPVKKGQDMLVISPTETWWASEALWLRVYDPVSRSRGYVFMEDASHIEDPDNLAPDPVLEQLEDDTIDWPTVVQANWWIRIVTWSLFAATGLLAAWKTTDTGSFLKWSAIALLASYYTVMTQMWPWYIFWALAFGALRPGSLPARLSLLLAGFVLTLYITVSYGDGDLAWVYTYRSLPAIVLPFVIFLLTLIPLCCGKKKSQPGIA